MLRFFLIFPFFFLLLFFLFVLFSGMLLAFLMQFLTKKGRKYKNLDREFVQGFNLNIENYREIIDLKERKKKKWIAILTVALIVIGLIFLNYLKIDKNGRIYWEKKQKVEKQEYI